ncbi:50S ribosomal protein L18e [Candidatus Woesearchaeota archaeon]|nr:50S ribosomal protein L18e [Candidatus Woesearchaeota archaeon]MCF7901635.1 50S ribosomal protein L18e [Candidatus Woesearchaeota archaeon]MCF8012987.1 50S ribosomal protein L18e [Candidatus Woesearchaeota archaeon]
MRQRKDVRNEEIKKLISELKKLSIDNNVKIWKRIAEDLEKPVRQKRIINLYKVDKYSKENDTIIVPGKVLGTGDINHKLTIAAFNFSEDALKKISEKGNAISIQELMKQNPTGKNIKILG